MTDSELHQGATGNIPWDEVGAGFGSRLILDMEPLTEKIKTWFSDLNEPGVPNFESGCWKYEFSIFQMFWIWYVANLPKLAKVGATKPLLDAYHKACCGTLMKAGLLSTIEDCRQWEEDLIERFNAYKGAFDNSPANSTIFTGTIGWMFARYLFPGERPNPKLAWIMTELGGINFRRLAETIKNLEATYEVRSREG